MLLLFEGQYLDCFVTTFPSSDGQNCQEWLAPRTQQLNLLKLIPVFSDPSKDVFIILDGKKVAVPQGEPIEQSQFSGSFFSNSEYLIYKESQCRIRYLLELHMSYWVTSREEEGPFQREILLIAFKRLSQLFAHFDMTTLLSTRASCWYSCYWAEVTHCSVPYILEHC